MTSIRQAAIDIQYTDGEVFSIHADRLTADLERRDLHTRVESAVLACGEGREIRIRLSAIEARPIRALQVKLQLDKAFADSQLMFFNNGYISNNFARIKSFAGSDGAIWRGLTSMRNAGSGEVFHAGFLSNDRLLTYFKIVGGALLVCFVLEDKPIPENGLELESFLLDEASPVERFLEGYADELVARYGVKLDKPIPAGWCSWSCFYREVNEQDLRDAAEALKGQYASKGADLLQIDDGWQDTHTFAGPWVDNIKQFPSGIARVSEYLKSQGLRFGLWYAPFNVAEVSELFATHQDWFVHDADGKPIAVTSSAGSLVYALDLGKGEVQDYLRDVFTKAVTEYGSVYFKLDFLNSCLIRGLENTLPFTGDDYAVAVLRKAFALIRQTVGPNVYLLGCGSPVHEAIGLFDAMRTTPDITWRHHQGYPNYWELLRDNTVTQLLRYFYHKRLFYNDADALVVRDYSADDGFDPSYEEARLWATTVALSGGPVLVNETIQKLGPARRKLIDELLPLYGEAAKPLDFFETPYCTSAVLRMPAGKSIVALYNWDDTYASRSLDLERLSLAGDVLAVDCWEKGLVSCYRGTVPAANMVRHSVKVYLLCERPEQPSFLFADNNFFCGADRLTGEFDPKTGVLAIRTTTGAAFEPCRIYMYAPLNYSTDEAEHIWSDDKGAVWSITAESAFEAAAFSLHSQ